MSFFSTTSTTTCNTLHCMIDIETLGTKESAPIISIGAVLFDPTGNDNFQTLYNRAFYAGIDIVDAMKVCGPADPETLQWWFKQTDAAIKRLVAGEMLGVADALQRLWRYTHSRTPQSPPEVQNLPVPTNVWAKSPSFDMKIISSACDKVKIKNPFFFSTERCVRTVQDLGFPNGDLPTILDGREGLEVVAHDARDDAVMQALMVQACYSRLGLGSDVAFHKN